MCIDQKAGMSKILEKFWNLPDTLFLNLLPAKWPRGTNEQAVTNYWKYVLGN